MSRTNPYKKKRRKASKTFLIFGEGLGEEIFVKYLRGLYSYNRGVAISVKRGRGGAADGIVIDADKIPGDFDRRIVVLDNDKSKTEMAKAKQEAENRKIELIKNTFCLEYVLLSILSNKKISKKDSSWYKKEFESKYLDKKKRSKLNEYAKLFPKKILNSKRSKIPELNKMISIMEGK